MKKTYLPRRSLSESFLALSWGGVVLALALVALVTRLLLPDLFWTVTAPLFVVSDGLGSTSHALFGGFTNSTTLTVENDRLSAENTALQNENIALKARLASLGALADKPGITAGVVARPPLSPYDTLVIAAGSSEGVTSGMEAFGAGNVPLGVVDSVSGHFARIALFTAPDMVTAGWVGSRLVALTLKGAGGGALSASIASDANVSVGDTVYVPGPGQLPVGRVADIETNQSSATVTLRIVPALNLFSVTEVLLRDTGIVFPGRAVATTTQP